MAARKRVPNKPKPLPTQVGSSGSKSPDKPRDTFNFSDLTLYLKLSILILLVLAVGGFLLYPDILNIMKAVHDKSFNNAIFPESEITQNFQKDDLLTNTQHDSRKDAGIHPEVDGEEIVPQFDAEDEEYLLENLDIYETSGDLKASQTQNVRAKEEAGIEKQTNKGNSLSEQEPQIDRTDTVTEKPSLDNKHGRNDKSQAFKNSENLKESQTQNMKAKERKDHKKQTNKGDSLSEQQPKRDRTDQATENPPSTNGNNKQDKKYKTGGKSGPIILDGKNSQVVLDPSQIKFIDSPSDESTSTKPKMDHEKTHKHSSQTQNSEKKHRVSNTESKFQKPSNTGDGNKLGENVDNVLEEANNFKPTFQKTFTPKKIFADGRRIPPIELLHQKSSNSSVRVFLFDDFLSQQECDGLIKAHDSHVKALDQPPILCFDSISTLKKHIKDARQTIDVTPNDFTKGTKCVNASFSLQLQTWMNSNWSYSTAFYPGESTFSKIIDNRIKEAMGLDPASGGKFQITSYPEGKAYKEHTDCILNGRDKRDRVVSVLMYLSDVKEGGETTFPELGIWVRPRKARALVWNNMSPDGVCEEHSKHAASVVKKGAKYILIRWYYYKTFYSLGRRPQPPPIPHREPGQAMVNCDEYNSGSCRWYDEWSYEPLLEYERNKYQLI